MKVWFGTALCALAMVGTADAATRPSCGTGPQYGAVPDYHCSGSIRTVAVDCQQQTHPSGPPYTTTNGCVVQAGRRNVYLNRCEWGLTPPPEGYDVGTSQTCRTGTDRMAYTCEDHAATTFGTHYSTTDEQVCSIGYGPASATCAQSQSSAAGGGTGASAKTSSCTAGVPFGTSATTGCSMQEQSSSEGGSSRTDACTTTVSRGHLTVTCIYEPVVYVDRVGSAPEQSVNPDPDADCARG